MSTSPLSAAITYGPRREGRAAESSSSWFSGMRVGLGDDPDARPARVREHGDARRVGAQREPQQVVGADLGAEARGVVAELADLGRGLVDEREIAVGDAHRARREQRVGGAALEQPRDVGIGEIEIVTGDEHVQAGGVAAAHLEPVERRERDLDRVVAGERAPAERTAAREILDRPGGREPVPLQRPHRVLARDERRVARLDVVGVLGLVAGRAVEAGLDRHEPARRARSPGARTRPPRPGRRSARPTRAGRAGCGRPSALRPRPRRSTLACRSASSAEQPGQDRVELGQERRQLGRRAFGGAPHHGDNSAHRDASVGAPQGVG